MTHFHGTGTATAKERLDYLFHHLFLPPKLPGIADDSHENESMLIDFVLLSLRRFLSEFSLEASVEIIRCIGLMEGMKASRDFGGHMSEVGVRKALRKLSFGGSVAAFHIVAQNAGVLIRRMTDSVIFETFELSPTNESVMTTRGRLIREFPATAIEISGDDFNSDPFQTCLAKTLVKMSHQEVQEMKGKAWKAGQEHDEERDTSDPRIVTELLTSILQGAGKRIQVKGICKNTRDEIVLSHSELPWRRSPLWLLVRVALQLTFIRPTGDSVNLYKHFMAFLMARVLDCANQQPTSSEVLHMMTNKVCRRLRKLKIPCNGQWLRTIQQTVSRTSETLSQRWEQIRARSEMSLDLKAVSGYEMKENTYFSLDAMETFLSSIPLRSEERECSTFSPIPHVKLFEGDALPLIIYAGDREHLPFYLAMVENWVAVHLDQWLERHIQEESSCQNLTQLIRTYHSKARKCYSSFPESASRMLLTVGELWIAADKAAIHAIPMLKEYDPEVPTKVWRALLLSSVEDMERLRKLEIYLLERQKFASSEKLPSVFRSYGKGWSFPVRYFAQSSSHQEMKQRIEKDATAKRQETIEKFHRLKDQYASLMQQYNLGNCEYTSRIQYGIETWDHSDECNRCRFLDRANELRIYVHEWPLPRDSLQAQATVFELAVPPVFAKWRDATIHLIHNVLLGKPSTSHCPTPSYPLRTYVGLGKYFRSEHHRIHLLSETKPQVVTHWKAKSIGSSEETDVCLNNGLSYQYYDEKQNSFLSAFSPSIDISNLCTFKLPNRAEALVPFLLRTWKDPNGETPNKTIASQSSCPDYMTLMEFKALSVLPYGYRLQWQNILVQLAMPAIDFNKAETAIFLLQMSLQAGPNSSQAITRCAHMRPSDLSFGHEILTRLEACISRVKENWESHIALCSFTFLATRLLSLVSEDLHDLYLKFLTQCREISYRWLMTLIEKVQETANESQRKGFSNTALIIALVCADSFNVEDKFMDKILRHSYQASILVEASVIIYNNSSSKNNEGDPIQGILLDRWRHTMHRARHIFAREVMDSKNSCLDLAIKRRWPAFQATSQWSIADSAYYWFETISVGLTVHLNIYTGMLLVNGLPLSRLPRDYEEHNDYDKLFGSLILEVMPSPLPGMRFSTTKSFCGYAIHFGMQDSPDHPPELDLLVHLEGNGTTLDLIPPRTFEDWLPHAFVKNYAHWYERSSETVEFCPLRSLWSSSMENWRLSRHGESWKLSRREKTFLLAPRRNLAKRIAAILSPLEEPLHQHMLYELEKNALRVEIPRLQLEFLLGSGESTLRSKDYRGMKIDVDQSVGTLIGFASKLVLRSEHDMENRMLIIPQGKISRPRITGDSPYDHVSLLVTPGSAQRVQAYWIDNLLGRLAANDGIENKLFLAYIHALTSFCLPDPFLKRTGTDEALQILQSASIRAPCRLSKVAYHILSLIADLAPNRSFYPHHLKVMQEVEWSSNLSCLSQDDRFYKITLDILERSREIDFLHPKGDDITACPTHTVIDIELVERSILRTSSLHVSGFGAEDFTTEHDTRYSPRDCIQSARGTRVAELASRIYNSHCTRFQEVSSQFASHVYEIIMNNEIRPQRSPPPKSTMEYDSSWLRKPKAFLPSLWCQLHRAFKSDQHWLDKFQLMVWISTVSYSAKNDDQITQALLMLALSPSVAATPLPAKASYDLSQGYMVQTSDLERFARSATEPFSSCPEARLQPFRHESAQDTINRRERSFESQKSQAVRRFSESLARQWPCKLPSWPQESVIETYINVPTAMYQANEKWAEWWKNQKFKDYLEEFACKLKELPMEEVKVDPFSSKPILEQRGHSPLGFVPIDNLFHNTPPTQLRILPPTRLDGFLRPTVTKSSNTSRELAHVLDFLGSKAELEYEKCYVRELRQSLRSLQDHPRNELAEGQVSTYAHTFQQHLKNCETHVRSIYESLSQALQPTWEREGGATYCALEGMGAIFIDAKFLPRISPLFLLQQLRRSRWCQLTCGWKQAIVEYGLAITALQQARRLVRFQRDPIDLLRELENTGHRGCDPYKHPEWLLLECESEIRIRGVQQQTAQQMIQPPENKNSVMQLNMGEGKSSVIVPIVATALGDGSKLVRVVVAKPQAKQMHQMLVSKLAGLLDRPVYQIPFSRDVRMDEDRAEVIHRLTSKCMKEGGVLMVQPEHLLSFQLMELECRLSGKISTADKMMETRQFFENCSRDVVDESDENFSTKFELIYTLGQQQPIEHSPDRWTIIQEVLGLVRDFSSQVKHEFPLSMEFEDRDPAKFPRIRILRPDAEKVIIDRVAHYVCEKGIAGFPISHQPPKVREAVHRYITHWELPHSEIEAVEESPFWVETTINHILLLRGLLSGGILPFALGQKRWRVNYGIDPNREMKTKLAVPFRAKDSPTPRSEFSHPDVVITLTCLSYYYGGLDDDALFSAFSLLVRSDNSPQEYQAWVKTAPTLPQPFQHLQGINLRDRVQCTTEIFPYLRYSKAVIDYYLCRLVFAKESKEFPHKLSASGWDLGKKKTNPTTGFSGTNDSRYVLPLEIKQLDLKEQNHTNALVLAYLLRPENGIVLMPRDMDAATFDSKSLLQLVASLSSNTRVILDVGAQVIDLNNMEFSRKWLSHYKEDENTQAVVFFNELDEIVVLDRFGKVEQLQTSPFADQLDQCLVFLDEAHTRGTDLKLPANYQAAVTLGANLTKDRLVQACMRMRKLGKGQTVVFCIPREIEQKILELRSCEGSITDKITVSDVLCWVITETCLDLRRAVPLWLNQGIRFYRQQVWWPDLESLNPHKIKLAGARQFMEDEAQSLDKRYHPKEAQPHISSLFRHIESKIGDELDRRCQEFGLTELRTSSLQEEQERELSPETEQERQIERPPPAKPAIHNLDPGLVQFVKKGTFAGEGMAFRPAFKSLSETSAASHLDLNEFPNNAWVTSDFATTVEEEFGSGNYSDSFQRPVQWILTSNAESNRIGLVIISPYEAQALLPSIEISKYVKLHLYAPRVNLGFRSLDHLDLYSIPKRKSKTVVPRAAVTHLNLFAGQLYLSTFGDYTNVCDALGLAWKAADEAVPLGPDGFIPQGSEQGEFVNISGFSKSPVRFLKVLMAKIRQGCEGIEKTHMGRILEGERLHESDFVEAK